jgi:hypothetical protein
MPNSLRLRQCAVEALAGAVPLFIGVIAVPLLAGAMAVLPVAGAVVAGAGGGVGAGAGVVAADGGGVFEAESSLLLHALSASTAASEKVQIMVWRIIFIERLLVGAWREFSTSVRM